MNIAGTPEAALWSAIMSQALKDALSLERGLRQSARAWLLTTERYEGSARWACDMLDIPWHAVEKLLQTPSDLGFESELDHAKWLIAQLPPTFTLVEAAERVPDYGMAKVRSLMRWAVRGQVVAHYYNRKRKKSVFSPYKGEHPRKGKMDRLPPETVRAIRADAAAGTLTHGMIGDKYGYSANVIYKLLRGQTYRDVL